MAIKTFHGSCHCKGLRFEADLDLDKGTGKCNCTYCAKVRNWAAQTTPAGFRWLAKDTYGEYGFVPGSTNHHMFCTKCGVRVGTEGTIPQLGAYVSVQLSTLDDLSVDELIGAKVHFANGLDNDWMHAPEETRQL